MDFWKISDFVIQIRRRGDITNLHANTVDGWFKRLEADKIHYINRTEDTDEKIYDELDLRIAVFIKKKREEKWSLGAISNDLANHFELRPFPQQKHDENKEISLHVDTIDTIKEQIKAEIKASFEQMAVSKIEEVKSYYESIIQQLPQPESKEDLQESRFKEMVLRKRLENKLEDKAMELWSTKPEEERMRRVGWFKREEDTDNKYKFIKEYVNKHYEEYLKKELGMRD